MKKENYSNIDLLTNSIDTYVPKHLISLLLKFLYIFHRRYLITLNKSILKT